VVAQRKFNWTIVLVLVEITVCASILPPWIGTMWPCSRCLYSSRLGRYFRVFRSQSAIEVKTIDRCVELCVAKITK
jgi:hypothetical protein